MTSNLYNSEINLIDQLCSGKSNDLSDLFDRRIKQYRHPFFHDECFTMGIFDDLIQKISCSRAFELIPSSLDVALKQTNQDLFVISLSLVAELAKASDTTELPTPLGDKLNALVKKVHSMQNSDMLQIYWSAIREWYRLS